MGQVYFHCSNAQKVVWDRRGTLVHDLPELREHAIRVIQSLIAAPTLEDWRNWILHVSDDLGEELFAIPFSSVLGRLH